MKPTVAQQRALDKMEPGREYNASSLDERYVTLAGLQDRGIVVETRQEREAWLSLKTRVYFRRVDP